MVVSFSPLLFLFLHDLRHEFAHLFGGTFLHLACDVGVGWNYTNGISETKAEQKSVTEIFDIRFIGAERISAVAGIDNMFMLAYDRNKDGSDCSQQSLQAQFTDKDGTTNKAEAKAHLTKFLDVTRSDMLFSDKVILVEGIAEKLLVPLFMEIYSCSYEDEHISIVEIGGKHFKYFVELFNGNAVKKKVLCITDKDFKWIGSDGNNGLRSYSEYENEKPSHITDLKEKFPIEGLGILHGVDKEEIYDFVRQTNPVEFANDFLSCA